MEKITLRVPSLDPQFAIFIDLCSYFCYCSTAKTCGSFVKVSSSIELQPAPSSFKSKVCGKTLDLKYFTMPKG